uniref:Leucine rich immune protein (Coil-less) n=1 Tax=Anopheles farauti TaxID=69004 RepID=A0A182QJ63_9DIPT
MGSSVRILPLWALMPALLSIASGLEYKCEPGTGPTVCTIRCLLYSAAAVAKNGSLLPTVNLPETVHTVRLLYDLYYYRHQASIARYDMTLHTSVLHDPPNVQLEDTGMWELVLPDNLQVGEFTNNAISSVVTNATKTYAVRYLDLSHNTLQSLTNLSMLVNLQSLNLESNLIRTIKPNVFERMRNLTNLYLSNNNLETFDLRTLPKSLAVLWLMRNLLHELPLTGVSLPALTELDLESNSLTTLDLPALFTAFPALRRLLIGYNTFTKEEAERIIADLQRHSITYRVSVLENENIQCNSDEYLVDKMCFERNSFGSQSFAKALFLLMLAILVVSVFGASVRWVWYEMRY